jgi:L-alanine-DL-glutamate epimerase-like enolase superfamily enzyme
MKIERIDAIPLAIPVKPMTPPSSWAAGTRKQIVVRVVTDGGLTGIGEAFAYGAPLAVVNVIVESLAPMLIGQDPTRIEALVDLMHRSTMIYGRRGLAMFAISGVEIALWDLLGKARGAPVHELLGGAVRPRLPVYASLLRYASPADVAAACRQFAAQGFRGLKLHQIDVDSVRAAREAVGPAVDLMLDTNCPWTPAEAIAMARALEPHGLAWLEEPVWPPEDYAGLARVRAATGTPIALGENESTVYGFREIIDRGAADILQPSITKVGGIAEFRKIVALAQAANLPIAPHAFYFGPGLAATLHVAATFGGATPVEFPTGEHETPFLAQPLVARDGWVEVPSGPGLGVEINEEAVRRYPYSPAGAEPFVLTR